MAYITKEIKKGIKLHCIETEKFKTNLLAMFITLPLTRENVTFDSVIPAVLKRGTEKLKTQEEISKKLENMYGAAFDCGIEKIGDNHVIKFYLEQKQYLNIKNVQNMEIKYLYNKNILELSKSRVKPPPLGGG